MSARLLEKLHTNGPAPHNYGICTQLSEPLTVLERGCLLHLMQLWPGSSGHANVPANRTDTSCLSQVYGKQHKADVGPRH